MAEHAGNDKPSIFEVHGARPPTRRELPWSEVRELAREEHVGSLVQNKTGIARDSQPTDRDGG